jgi:YD repeat-containing protein
MKNIFLMENKKNHMKLLISLIFIIMSEQIYAIQWCGQRTRDCYETPQEVCEKSAFSISSPLCSREFIGISSNDAYGPVQAKCTISHELSGNCESPNAHIVFNTRLIQRTGVCNSGYSLNENAMCVQYSAAVPQDSTPPQHCSGNPIDTSIGTKIQKEIDIDAHGIGQINFNRTYSNASKFAGVFWFNPYQKFLQVIDPQTVQWIREKSSPYTNKALACVSGWNEIKTKIIDNWAYGTTAQYINETCQILRNNVIVRNIPILPKGQSIVMYIKPGSIQLVRENGSIFSFGLSTNDQYHELNGERGQLTAMSNSAPIAWRFKTNSGDIEDYNADGKLLSITTSNGMRQELFYDVTSGLLSSVKDSTGRELLFSYTGNQISSVTVDGNKTTSYTYNALGLITQVTRPDNTTRIYHYEDTRFPTALTGITDERGARYATWVYDAQGRAISSEHAGGAEKTLLAFNTDGSTTVTNALNKQTIYRFDDIAGARRVTKVEGQPTANCIGANQDYTYTPEGWIASKTDWKGIKTTFTYNTAGQEISRTEAFGTPEARTTTTEWHPTLFVKTKITEPEKETVYSYDANGRLLNQSTQSISVQ